MNRRSFFGTLLAAPVAVKAAPAILATAAPVTAAAPIGFPNSAFGTFLCPVTFQGNMERLVADVLSRLPSQLALNDQGLRRAFEAVVESAVRQ